MIRGSDADLVVIVDRVITMSDARGRPATTVAIRDGRITAVGSADLVTQVRGSGTRIEHFPGAVLTPGLIDAHTHPLLGVQRISGLDLGDVTELAVLAERIAAATDGLGPNEWVRGWNVGYEVFAGRLIDSTPLERVLGGRPMLLLFFDGHTALASRAALELTDRTLDGSDSAVFVVDGAGRPTGEVREESAIAAVLAAAPEPDPADTERRARQVLADMARVGYTGGCFMDGDEQTLDLLDRLEDPAELPIRVTTALQHDPDFGADRVADHLGMRDRRGRRWRGGLIKLYADGVIDTGTGWLAAPDSHHEGVRGLWSDPIAFRRTVAAYARAGFQIATHAIGDAAITATLDAYEQVGAGGSERGPHRIEHLELLADRDVRRLRDLGVTASMQPSHMQWRHADGSDSWAERVGAGRTGRAWRIGDLVRSGVRVALGSDWPVAGFDPREIMAWARLRRAPGARDSPAFEEDQVISGRAALAGFTVDAAAAQGDQDAGVLEVGRRADLTVWADDPTRVDADDLPALPILATFLERDATFRADD